MRSLRTAVLVLCLVAWLRPVGLLAQTSSVSGRLTEAGSGDPVAAAAISLPGTALLVVTDEQGRFRFGAVPPGRYELRVEHLGYGVRTDSVSIAADANVVLALRISARALELEPIRVEARSRAGGSRSGVITRDEIEPMIGRARNIAEVVRVHVPGATLSERRGGIVCLEFRAARTSRTTGCNYPMVVVDDLPIQQPGTYLRDAPIEDIERIEFVPASEGAGRWGLNSQYGVLVITTRRSGVRARPVVERPPSRYPAYQWQAEPGGHPFAKSFGAATIGNLAGTMIGLAVLGCFPASGSDSRCVVDQGVGSGLAVLAFPAVGAVAGSRLFGATAGSTGRPLYSLVATAIPLLLGYAAYTEGERSGLGSSRMVGGALIIVGTPLVAAIADRLFRRARGGVPPG